VTVGIDQDLCTGDGRRVDHCSEDRLVGHVIAAAEDCPGACTFLQVD
jgi:hypothetical protein